MTFAEFMAKISTVIVQPILALVFGIAFIIFIWGVFVYIRDSDDDKGRAEGQRSILWGLVGMVIMISAFGIINIIQGTIGVDQTPGQTTIEGQIKPSLEGAGIQ
jgi:uncharacterized membrane protein